MDGRFEVAYIFEARSSRFVRTERDVVEAKEQLIRAWIQYQVARLELYQALQISQPASEK